MMSEYRLEVTGNINLSDYSNISDYLELVDYNDKFTITLESVDNQNVDILCSMLEDKRFIITSRGDKENGKFNISAHREKQ